MKHVILASGSPRRREILAGVGLKFEVVTSDYEENNALSLPPGELVEQLSSGKAIWVAEKHPDAVVIAADTLVFLDGSPLGKPRDQAELKKMIGRLNGRAHSVFTGFTIIEGGRVLSDSVETKVYFRSMSEAEINGYAATGEGLDKAGGYGAQGIGALFIEKIEGDYLNVVGLPLCRLNLRLKEFGIDLLND